MRFRFLSNKARVDARRTLNISDSSSSISERHGSRRAFTLVEMLVAIAVLILLVAMLGQVVELTSRAITLSSRTLEAAGEARVIFDRLGADLAARPKRTDLPMLFTKATGNDSFEFYSQVGGYNATGQVARQISLVGYRIQETTTPFFQFERGATGMGWLGSGNSSLLFQPQALAPTSINESDYDVLADSVFRLEFCYLLNTGALSNSANSDYSNVVAIVVAVGALDTPNRLLLSNTQIESLSSQLPDVAEGQDPISGWNAAMKQAAFGAGIPAQAIQNVRIFQRFFSVP
jgi:prepilin-type N-terminal cleavage/methylation domain-containing protein